MAVGRVFWSSVFLTLYCCWCIFLPSFNPMDCSPDVVACVGDACASIIVKELCY